jgi:hypothetical protein
MPQLRGNEPILGLNSVMENTCLKGRGMLSPKYRHITP